MLITDNRISCSELLTCRTPFAGDDAALMNSRICSADEYLASAFPSEFDPIAKDLILSLLKGDPASRLGMREDGMRGLWAHPFFEKTDMNLLHQQTLLPPYTPQLSGAIVASHFQQCDNDEEDIEYTGTGRSFMAF
jgi:serine/threonine protein kinase